ncbi:3-ketoacyl-ACP reductase [Bacillus carboniphilus]|uniref:3-ketoacyl-ACP reductase n=1 Tax=Bacillus carboniphilus TaxID=86663 RepID=A0ABN0WM91_9BACI
MRAVLITGGGTGLGKELAHLFARQSFKVLLCGRKEEPLMEVKAEIEKLGGTADAFTLDVTNYEEMKSTLNQIRMENLEIIVNNAGIGIFGSFENMPLSQFEDMMRVNYFGPLYLCKMVIPHLLKKNKGIIINIISTAGLHGKANEAGYCASKFALRGLGESLQKEYEGRLRVVNVFMGGMNTPFWEDSTHVSDPSQLMNPRDIAELIFTQYEHKEEVKIERKKP